MLEPDTRYVQVVAALATMAAGTTRRNTKTGLFIMSFSKAVEHLSSLKLYMTPLPSRVC
jgi:hypothetical protein